MKRSLFSGLVLSLVMFGSAFAARLDIYLPGIDVPVEAANNRPGTQLTLIGPNGLTVQRTLGAGDGGAFNLGDIAAVDGNYRYQIDLNRPTIATRAGNGPNGRATDTPAPLKPLPSISGSFAIVGGQMVQPQVESATTDSGKTPSPKISPQQVTQPADLVVADDLIVDGSECVGTDCVVNESFGFDTLRLKQNNTRITFDDTSDPNGGFPWHSWTLLANDSFQYAQNKFSIQDITAGTTPFTILGGAPNDSIFVDSSGHVGLHTSTPALDIHIVNGDTPAIRLQQSGGYYVPQTWDIAGNETNFFIRDVTNGSHLPFVIRPGAPTSSIDIGSNGHVAFGFQAYTAPTANIEIRQNKALSAPVPILQVTNYDSSTGAAPVRFVVDSSGNVLARGTISQLSSRTAKRDFRTTNGRMLLAKLEKMPIDTWRYKGAPANERHLGPVAEDFHAAFGLGKSNRYIAPTDMAGVALASIKAMQREIVARDKRIAELEQRLDALEKKLDARSH